MALTDRQQEILRKLPKASQQAEPEPEGWQSGGAFSDTAVGLAAGALELPSMAAGLADMGTALGPGAISRAVDHYRGAESPSAVTEFLNRPFSRGASALGEATGISPSTAAENLRENRYSEQMQASRGAVDTAWEEAGEQWGEGNRLGAIGQVAGAYLRNPRTIQGLVTESLPATIAGGLIGRGLMGVAGTRAVAAPITSLTPAAGVSQASGAAVATGQAASRMADLAARQTIQQARLSGAWGGALGQAPVFSGAAMSQIDDEVDPQRAALAALGIGAGSAVAAGAGAQLAGRVGLVDIDTAIASGSLRKAVGQQAPQRGLVARVSGGSVAEGGLQDLPQEAINQMGINWAEGEPLLKGVPRASIEGMLAGGAMGAAVNIPSPRRGGGQVDLTNTVTRKELGDSATGERDPNAAPELAGSDLSVMLRYHRRMTRIAQEATAHPDLQEKALERIQGVLAELEARGVPQEVVQLELAKDRYTEAQLELQQMQKQYRDALATDPQRARAYLDKSRARAQEIAQLEQVFTAEQLTSPDLATIRTLQEMDGTERYFRRDGVRMKKAAQNRLEQFRTMDAESLARQLNNDIINAENGLELDNWAPMRAVVAEQRGITSEYLEQVNESDAGGDLRRAREAATPAPANVTMAEDIRTDEQGREAVAQFDDEALPPRPAAERLQDGVDALPTEQRRVWDATLEVIQSAGEGISPANLAQRVGELTGKTAANVKATFPNVVARLRRSLGVTEGADNLTLARLVSIMSAPVGGDAVAPIQRSPEQLAADMDPTVDVDVVADGEDVGPSTVTPDIDMVTDQTEIDGTVSSPQAELLGAGAATIQSVGGSQAAISDRPDAATSREARRAYEEFEAQLGDQATTEDAATAQEIAAQENAAAAEARRAQLQAQAEAELNSEDGRIAGEQWDRRADPSNPQAVALWPDGVQPPSWAAFVAADPQGALAWMYTLLDIVHNNPQSMHKQALRTAFAQTAQEIQNDIAAQEAGQPRYTRPEPVQPAGVEPGGADTATVAAGETVQTGETPDDGAAQAQQDGAVDQARIARVGQALQESYVANPSPEKGQALVALARAEGEAVLPALEAAEALIDAEGGATPSTQATAPGAPPVVRRRGRRQPIDARTLQPAQAATSEAIEQAGQAAAEPNAGPEALEQHAVLMRRDADADGAERGVRPAEEQIANVEQAIEVVNNPASTLDQVLDTASRLAGDNPGLQALIETLRTHPSLSNVRFLANALADASQAYGHYYADTHAVYINGDIYHNYALEMELELRHPSEGIDGQMAETIVHELVHAASIRYLEQNYDTAVNEMRPLVEELVQYVNANRAKFSDAEYELLRIMIADPAEIITYTLTDPTIQNMLSRIPSEQSPQRGMLGRVVQAIMNMLGLSEHSGTMLEALATLSSDLLGRDAAYTRQHSETIRNVPQDTWDMRMREATQDLQTMVDGNWDVDPYIDALEQYTTQADEATMAGDDAARTAALDGLTRTMQAIRDRATELRDEGVGVKRSVRPLEQRAVDPATTLSNRMYDAALTRAPRPVQNWLTSMKNMIRRLPQAVMFSHDFVDYAKQSMPAFGKQVESYFNSVFHRLSERNNQHVAIQKIVDPISRFTAQQREQVNTVLRDSTYSEKWAFQPDWIGTVPVDPALSRQFEALPPVAQKIVKEMFQYAYASNQQVQRQLQADIVTTYDSLIEKAKTPKQISKLQTEKASALAEHAARQIDPTTPYLPLKRWGEWAVVHKSQQFKQAEARKNRREINAMKSDPAHYRVEFAESEFQARQARDRMSEELGVAVEEPFQRMRYEQSNEAIPMDLMNRLRNEALGDSDPANMSVADRRIASAIDRLYIEALEESSVRKSELRRLKVEGAGRDMVRAFVEHGQGLAALSAAMKLNKETRKIVSDMKREARNPTNVQDRPRRMEVLNEVLARHALALEVDSRDNWQQKVMGYTSIWMLLTSPAYYIQNSTQPFMLTYPVLAARFGSMKSMGFMRRAYKDVFAAQRSTRGDELLDPMRLADPEEQALFGRLQRLNLMDVGIAADLGTLQESRGVVGQKFDSAHRKMLTAVRTVEVYNRGVTAIASYRLQKQKLEAERESGANQLSDSAISENAKQYAMKMIQTTQGDYSEPNAPRLISMLPAGRVLTQFRKFQLIQIGLLTRTFHQAFKGASPEERTIGRRQMAYILGMHGVIGGAMGLPAANIIGYAIAKAFGDEDEPANAELLARRAIGNKEVADLVLRGLPARFGVDASNRLGMGLTFSVIPFADVTASRDGMFTVLGHLLGPTAGLAAQGADGIGQMMEGNVAMGTAQLLPSILRNGIRAYMYQTDGVRRRNGDLAMSAEELSWFDVATQGLGWPGKKITDRYFATGALMDVQKHFRGRTTKIKKAYVAGFQSGDREAMSTAIEQWTALQNMRREYGVGDPQPLSNLMRAPREREERERFMVEGVPTQRTTRRFVEALFE